MLQGLDPNDVISLTPAACKGEPEASRPVFEFEALTARDFRRLINARAAAAKAATDGADNRDELRSAAILIGLIGWRNVFTAKKKKAELFGVDTSAPAPWAIPFKPEMMDDILTIDAQWDLLDEYPTTMRLSEQAKNPSASSSTETTGTMGFVKTAGEANASKSPVPDAPLSSAPTAPNVTGSGSAMPVVLDATAGDKKSS